MNKIYFDNAATKPVRREVFEAMRPFLEGEYGNPSSVYEPAQQAKAALENARKQVAAVIGAQPKEIYFTGGATEANNWAIRGVAEAYESKGKHIITSVTEHHAVLAPCEYLEKRWGYDVTYLPVDEFGQINPAELEKAIRPDTVLITIMFANNEIGTLQDIKEIGRIAKEHGVLFHTDAVQAVGLEKIDVKEMNIDLLSLSAHKIYGPKGVGALYAGSTVKIKPLIMGGAQERKRRAGTENMPGIVGLGKAIELAEAEREDTVKKLVHLQNRIIDGVLETIPHTRLNGHPTKRAAGNISLAFEFIEGESLLLLLDMQGIYASSGSACTSGSLDPSHVLLAIGLPHEKAHGSLRISLGRYNTEAEADTLIKALPPIVQRLRDMSPLYEEFIKSQKN